MSWANIVHSAALVILWYDATHNDSTGTFVEYYRYFSFLGRVSVHTNMMNNHHPPIKYRIYSVRAPTNCIWTLNTVLFLRGSIYRYSYAVHSWEQFYPVTSDSVESSTLEREYWNTCTTGTSSTSYAISDLREHVLPLFILSFWYLIHSFETCS